MSKTIVIRKEVCIEDVSCNECGQCLTFNASTDSFGDLYISVDKCNCGEEEE